ncbi:MAG: type III secretion HpaP family protein [Puniceicoccales bacterium]|jgi:hypothetical protein|nr:type III secretion HpaP family protein [Puniceicoccales bacterium]
MSEIKINNTSDVIKPVRVESAQVRTKEQPDVRDVDGFQALLSERVEGDQKREAKRGSKNGESDLGKPNESPLIFGLFLNEESENFPGKVEITVAENPLQGAVEVAARQEKETNESTEDKAVAGEDFIPTEIKSEAKEIAIKTEKNEVVAAKNPIGEAVKVKVEGVVVGQGEETNESVGNKATAGKNFIPTEINSKAKEIAIKTEKNEVVAAKNPIGEAVKIEMEEVAVGQGKEANESEEGKAAAGKNFIPTEIKSEAKEIAIKTEKDKDKPEKDKIVKEISTVVKEAPINVPLGEKILDSLGQVSNTQSVASAETISKIGNEIIERLMIVQSINAAKQEVVVAFKENVLPGTQVSLVREKSELSLVFTTFNAQSMEFLVAGHDGLRNFLLEQLKDTTAVHIKFEGRESGDLGEKNSQRHRQNQQSEKENDENMA